MNAADGGPSLAITSSARRDMSQDWGSLNGKVRQWRAQGTHWDELIPAMRGKALVRTQWDQVLEWEQRRELAVVDNADFHLPPTRKSLPNQSPQSTLHVKRMCISEKTMGPKKAFDTLHERSAFVLKFSSRFLRHFVSHLLPTKH